MPKSIKAHLTAVMAMLAAIAILNSSCAIFRRCDAYAKKEAPKKQMESRSI